MILTGDEIERCIANGSIAIKPYSSKSINPNSYNYHLGPTLLEADKSVIDPKKEQKFSKITIPKQGYTLQPGKLYLASTVESIGSDEFMISLIGRSSVGRLGLFVQITADMSNIGSNHHWTLEIMVVQPLIVYPGMTIGQISFWTTDGDSDELYVGKYHAHTEPHMSKLHEEYKRKGDRI